MLNALRTLTAAAAAAVLTLGIAGPASADGGSIVVKLQGPELSDGTTLTLTEKKANALRELRVVARRKNAALDEQAAKMAKVDISTLTEWSDFLRPVRSVRADQRNLNLTVRSVSKASTLIRIRQALRFARSYRPANFDTMAYGYRQAVRLRAEIYPLLPLVPKDETYSPKNRLDGLIGSAAAIHARSPRTQLTATRSKVAWVEEALEELRKAAEANAPAEPATTS